jgi:sulfate transport system permease protein
MGIVVLLPLAAMVLASVTMGWRDFWAVVSDERTLSAYRLSLGASAAAAVLNVFVGMLIAWVLARYVFFGRRLVDALIDLPFALPTAVAGIALLTIYSPNGWIGSLLADAGFRYPWPRWVGFDGRWWPVAWQWFDTVASSPLGLVLALSFVGLPFVVRTVQPVLEDLGQEAEEASGSLGATRWQTFRFVILPQIRPALLTGFALSFARGLGEFGSVVFIAGKSDETTIAPFVIIDLAEQHRYASANAIAVGLMLLSFAILLVLNLAQRYFARRGLEG